MPNRVLTNARRSWSLTAAVTGFFQPSFLLELGDFRATRVQSPGASDRACARLAVDTRCQVEPRLPVIRVERYRRAEARLRPRRVALLEPCRTQRLKRDRRPGHPAP